MGHPVCVFIFVLSAKISLHTQEVVAALPRYTSCDATLFQPLKSTAHQRPHVDHSDDDEHDDGEHDDDDEDEDDEYEHDDDLALLVW